jgi:hypothetical protein
MGDYGQMSGSCVSRIERHVEGKEAKLTPLLRQVDGAMVASFPLAK